MTLQIEQLHAFYGKSHVLRGVNLQVQAGEIVALLGRNGSGRSTLAKAIMGLVQWQGSMRYDGHSLAGLRTFEIAQAGLGYVPEGREVFPRLTVEQNLELGRKSSRRAQAGWSMDDMYAMFPQLRERRQVEAGVLSGGEQQMLALCRTLMGDPRLIIVDEPTEGLAPMLAQQVAQYLLALKQRGVGVLLIEQKLDIALQVADRVSLMGQGEVLFQGALPEFK